MRSCSAQLAARTRHSTFRASAVSSKRTVVCRVSQAKTTGIDRSAPNVVCLKANWRSSYSIQPGQSSTTVGDYIANAQQNLQGYELPVGAKLEPVNTDAGDWVLQLPALTFLDVSIRPCAKVKMTTRPGRLDVVSTEVTIAGSQRVDDLNLQDRYDIDVVMSVIEQASTQFEVAANLKLYVDVPPPFSLTPKRVTEAGGNAVVSGLLASLMPGFAQIMVQDMEGRYRRSSS